MAHLASRHGLSCLFLALVIGIVKANTCSPESPGSCPSTDQTTLLQSRVGVSEAVLQAVRNEGQGYDGNEEAEDVDLLAKEYGEAPRKEWVLEDEEEDAELAEGVEDADAKFKEAEEAEDSGSMAEDEEEAEDAELAEGVEDADAEFKETEDAELAKGEDADAKYNEAEEAEDSGLMAEDEEEAKDAQLADGVEDSQAEFKEAEDVEGAEDEAESEDAEDDDAGDTNSECTSFSKPTTCKANGCAWSGGSCEDDGLASSSGIDDELLQEGEDPSDAINNDTYTNCGTFTTESHCHKAGCTWSGDSCELDGSNVDDTNIACPSFLTESHCTKSGCLWSGNSCKEDGGDTASALLQEEEKTDEVNAGESQQLATRWCRRRRVHRRRRLSWGCRRRRAPRVSKALKDGYHQECWTKGGCKDNGKKFCAWCGQHKGEFMYCCSARSKYADGHACNGAKFRSGVSFHHCVTPSHSSTPQQYNWLDLSSANAKQSSTSHWGKASRAIDGYASTSWSYGSCTHTRRDWKPWFEVDLRTSQSIKAIAVTNRGDCCGWRLNGFSVRVGGNVCATRVAIAQGETKVVKCEGVGSKIRVELAKREYLTICELRVATAAAGAPTTKAPTTVAPTTQAPTTEAPTTKAPTTASPTTQAPSSGVLTQSQKDAIVNKHNALRAGLGASDMMKMTWDDTLANAAQQYVSGLSLLTQQTNASSQKCPRGHSQNRANTVGENMAWKWSSGFQLSANTDFTPSVQSWYDEIKDAGPYKTGGRFDGFGKCTGVCGHYTQVVWAAANKIGCGAAYCPHSTGMGGYELVCQYGTTVSGRYGGNMGGATVFTPGTACSQCPSGFGTCSSNLCAKGAQGTTAPPTTPPATVAPTPKAPTVAPTKKGDIFDRMDTNDNGVINRAEFKKAVEDSEVIAIVTTTGAPTTGAPTTKAPTTVAPTTQASTTAAPSTASPTVAPTSTPTKGVGAVTGTRDGAAMAPYKMTKLAEGVNQFNDRSYKLTGIPSSLLGGTLFQGPCHHKRGDKIVIQPSVGKTVRVYVLVSKGNPAIEIAQMPKLLSSDNGWDRVTNSVMNTNSFSATGFEIFSKAATGKVSLMENTATGAIQLTMNANIELSIVLKEQAPGTQPASTTPAPTPPPAATTPAPGPSVDGSPAPTAAPTPATTAAAPTGSGPAPAPHPGGFCGSRLYTDTPNKTCEDGATVNSNGCCAATNRCPKSCSGGGWSMSRGVVTCHCSGCPFGNKLSLTEDERYLRATNYFRCRHGQKLLTWDSKVATNAAAWAKTCAGQRVNGKLNPPHTRPDGTNAYANTPMSGENVAAGSKSPEKAVELWYNEITNPGYRPGVSPDVQPGVGHYTAMIWASTGKLGCAMNACPHGTPKPVYVCHYAMMAPNSGGDSEYYANVPQTNTPTATEETCCQKMYGDASAATNPFLNPGAVVPTPAPTQPPSTQGPCMGIFTSNDGTKTVLAKPWQIGSVWVYGAFNGGWFKMVSVDKDGKKLEARHSKTQLKDSMTPAQLKAVWDAANRGGAYSVEVTLGDTTAPPPAMKGGKPKAGDAEGTIYTSIRDEMKGDETGWRLKRGSSNIRRRMRGDYYAIAKTVSFKLVKSGAQCRSRNKYYGCWLKTAADCAKKMKKEGKKFFIWHPGTAKLMFFDKKCYGETTTSETCPEGFSSTGFNAKYSFYSVLA